MGTLTGNNGSNGNGGSNRRYPMGNSLTYIDIYADVEEGVRNVFKALTFGETVIGKVDGEGTSFYFHRRDAADWNFGKGSRGKHLKRPTMAELTNAIEDCYRQGFNSLYLYF